MQILAGVKGAAFDISGGQETVTVGGYKYVVFTSSGTLTITMPGNVEFCTVGGGAGGGSDGGGGGGAELDLFASFALTANATITIGAGGIGGDSPTSRGANGGTSTVVEGSTLQSALGGGGGGSYVAGGVGINNGATGGSGGGSSAFGASGGGASGSNTNVGGVGVASPPYYGGGGGGATAAGSSSNGTGGQGYQLTTIDANLTAANFPTTLTGITFVSSGGGGENITGSAPGPVGGTNAGNGGVSNSTNPTAGTGYGCGGGASGDGSIDGAVGFKGVVIARIPA